VVKSEYETVSPPGGLTAGCAVVIAISWREKRGCRCPTRGGQNARRIDGEITDYQQGQCALGLEDACKNPVLQIKRLKAKLWNLPLLDAAGRR
jgi:hypothetical protein